MMGMDWCILLIWVIMMPFIFCIIVNVIFNYIFKERVAINFMVLKMGKNTCNFFNWSTKVHIYADSLKKE